MGDVSAFLEQLITWAAARDDVRAVGLAGSWARGTATAGSDVDLVLIVEDVHELLDDGGWPARFGRVVSASHEDWGLLQSRRVHYADGSEVEFGLTTRQWAAVPLDPGTRQVVADGFESLYDPDGLLLRCTTTEHQNTACPSRVGHDGGMSDDPLLERLREVVIGHLGPVRVGLVDHDPAWAQRFASHAHRIRDALGVGAARVEHIGSTAVPGLAAKPIIDILLVVDDPADEASYLPELENAGYELRVREADVEEHRMLRTPTDDVHIHVFPGWSAEIDRYLTLRDHLTASPAARAVYEARKRELANREWPTMDHYANAKGAVIEALIAEAGRSDRDR